MPLFFAINILGIVPMFLGFTESLKPKQRKKLIFQALSAAFVLAFILLFAGHAIFETMGITVNDLKVAGGIILLVLSITDIIFGDLKRRDPTPDEEDDDEDHDNLPEGIGVVPIGIPLTIGPGAITAILVAQQTFGYGLAFLSLLANILLVGVVYYFSPAIFKYLGKQTTQAVAKVASLFLAAIAVAMIRDGIKSLL